MLALSRLYLENILNIQSSWVTPGLKTCQIGLRFGGNDVGSIMIEENVVSAAGTHHQATEEELRRLIRDAGHPQTARYAVSDVFLELNSPFAIDRDRGKLRGSPPPTPPESMRVRIRRFGGLSNRFHS